MRSQLPGRGRRARLDALPPRGSPRPTRPRVASREIAPGRSKRMVPPRHATIVELQPERGGAVVENPVDAPLQVGGDMFGARRADPSRPVRGRRDERLANGLDQRARDPVGGRAQRDRIQPRPREQADPAGRRDLGHDRQRARPERRREPGGARVEVGLAGRRRCIGEMRDQRIERRPALRGEDRSRGGIGGRQGGEPVDRLGRHRHQPARSQRGGRGGDVLGSRGRDPRGTMRWGGHGQETQPEFQDRGNRGGDGRRLEGDPKGPSRVLGVDRRCRWDRPDDRLSRSRTRNPGRHDATKLDAKGPLPPRFWVCAGA